ncbi:MULTISPECIES: calcium-binding protein [unclassified Pseudovibrio]|uniref:calcium-binding protein n=1 Tax=unclassified Pseudovibrio TaxID=2627060 RepID=UPI0007AEDB99|nr:MULTISPECIES: calcium-binding protein [unclassified Pseudovibrio]KZK94257.1 Bifunctional hemolysin/adenylate cyclase precursor [Pseudovibrio sp. W74]KZL09927.1 Bifunctional hemolysin/adenylate cyclase precursor [Pseudovibrio sp. Ad14]
MEYQFGNYDDNFSNNSPEDDIIRAGGGNDTIHMAFGNNTLLGEAGNDSLIGGEGDDYLDGGTGNDTLSGGLGRNTYFFNRGYDKDTITEALGSSNVNFGAGISLDDIRITAGGPDNKDLKIYLIDPENPEQPLDEIADVLTIENGVGTPVQADQLVFADGTTLPKFEVHEDGSLRYFGTDDDDIFVGSNADEEIYGSTGVDVIDGGGGRNAIRYNNSSEAVSINLATGQMSGGDAEGDQLTNISQVFGTSYDDVIIGDDNNNGLFGLDGDDHLDGGGGDDWLNAYGSGSDYLNGGTGNDTVRYRWSKSAVTVDLADQANNAGDAAGDTYVSIENVMGSDEFSDTIIGDTGNNKLWGYGGDDTITGGDGNDIFLFEENFEHDTITDFTAGAGSEDTIHFSEGTFGNFEDVIAAASDVGTDTVIQLDDDNSVTLQNVSITDLHADDFAFV